MAAEPDWRNIRNGLVIPDESYADQPYIVTNADGHWVVTMTTNPAHEGAPGQHVVSRISEDQGRTWTHESDIEWSGPHGYESSWATPIFAPKIGPQGRIYCFYTYNGDHVTTVPGETNRVDTLGYMVFRYSDDGGRSWSRGRYRVPIARTEVDRHNPFADLPDDHPDRNTQLFWSVAKPVIKDGSVYLSFTKVGHFPGHPTHSEGWVLQSSNLLSEPDARLIDWQLLPGEQDVGIRSSELDTEYKVQAEHVAVPLAAPGSLYMVYRNMKGVAAKSISTDSGWTWSVPDAARFADGRVIKNPRANVKVWRTKNGRYLLWFHNHGRISNFGFDGRDVAWLSGGVEVDGDIVWGEPEIVLYDPEPTTRFSYPDLVEQDGRYWLTETNKSTARVHAVPTGLIEALWNPQLPEGRPIWTSEEPSSARFDGSFTLDLSLEIKRFEPGALLFDSRGAGGAGISVVTTEDRAVRLSMTDESGRSVDWASDPGSVGDGRHSVAAIVDTDAKVISFVVDGRQNDGGEHRDYGWQRFTAEELSELGDLDGCRLNDAVSEAEVYDRALLTSEAVALHRSRH